ncbi:glycosyltransferase [Pedobacter sp. AW1-32]|uniref:glycosyltransferase n=1 Tax=Pedobacter sp. AW1-32 TaxID=3383026 RepID=UPI003FF1174F
MISVIIASVRADHLAQVEKNLSTTIGIPFEIISFDNSEGKLGLCDIYNRGASKAKYDVLCFMHEDIIIHTPNWGEIVLNIFNTDKKLGLIGIAGSQYKSLAPSGWHCYEMDAPEIIYYNILQNYKFKDRQASLDYSNPTHTKLAEVVCIDGVWMCCTKQAYNSYPFDATLLKGFHGYDLDFALGIKQNYKVGVTLEILVEHFSEGNFNKMWLNEILKVHAKWNNYLPINLCMLSDSKILNGEKRGFKTNFRRMWNEGFTIKEMYNVIQNSKASPIMTKKLYYKLLYRVLKFVLKRRAISS